MHASQLLDVSEDFSVNKSLCNTETKKLFSHRWIHSVLQLSETPDQVWHVSCQLH